MIKPSLVILLSMLILPKCAGTRPADLGVTHGTLGPCPSSPNCVSSQASDKAHYVAPLYYRGALTEAKKQITLVIKSMSRAKIVTDKGNYIHAEFSSALFGFVDDVEFYFDDTQKTIQIKSASRLGYSDFGVNRRRVEKIRATFMKYAISKNRDPSGNQQTQ